MEDLKTVREALGLEVKLIERTILNIENGKYRRVNGNELHEMLNGQKERIEKALFALDRIEAVETVTVKQAYDMGIDAMDSSFIMGKFPNGIRIKEDK